MFGFQRAKTLFTFPKNAVEILFIHFTFMLLLTDLMLRSHTHTHTHIPRSRPSLVSHEAVALRLLSGTSLCGATHFNLVAPGLCAGHSENHFFMDWLCARGHCHAEAGKPSLCCHKVGRTLFSKSITVCCSIKISFNWNHGAKL